MSTYGDLAPFLKGKPWNTVDGKVYGVPHGWGANLLMFNKDALTPAPDSWGACSRRTRRTRARSPRYDSPIYIADARCTCRRRSPT